MSEADVQAAWHGVLEIVRLHCNEAQQVGCFAKVGRLSAGCRTQVSSHNSQGVVDGGVYEAGMSTVAPNRRAAHCG